METSLMNFTNQQQIRITSLQIAEITGKEHSHVMRDIRAMEPAWEKIGQSKFGLAEYTDKQNKLRPCYSLTQEECLYIATKYNDEARAKIIMRWKQLEIEKRNSMPTIPQTFSQALLLAAKQAEQIEEQQKLIEAQSEQVATLTNAVAEMQEKVSYVDRILASKETVTITQIAQDYGISAKALNKKLFDLHIQHRVNKQWILYIDYLPCGYVQSKSVNITRTNGKPDVVLNTEWTQKGRLFLYETLKKQNILPLIER